MAAASPKIRFRDTQIEMAHGAGGKASRRLIEGLFAPILFGSSTEPLGDAAHISMNGTRIAITADSFVVSPLRFPGGSIGELAVNGTVNDLAVSGARAETLVVTYRARSRPADRDPGGRSSRHGPGRARRRRHHRGRRHQGGRTRQGRPYVHHHRGRRPPHSRRAMLGALGAARRCRSCFPVPSATTASPSCWRAANWISRRTSVPTRAR